MDSLKPSKLVEREMEKERERFYDRVYYDVARILAYAQRHGRAQNCRWTLKRDSFPYPKRNRFPDRL